MSSVLNETDVKSKPNLKRLKILATILSISGVSLLFISFIQSVSAGLSMEFPELSFGGFLIIIFLYFLRICVRASAWRLSVHEPYKLKFTDTLPAVIIGEAISSLIPLGILASGTSKAIAVRTKIPLVAALSSVATENLFYTFVTSIFIICGAVAFLFNFQGDESWTWTIYALIGIICTLLLFCFLLILRQWHLASGLCEWIYEKGFLRRILENGRSQVRLFENLIFDFYRSASNRFAPIIFYQILYHVFGVAEVWFILSRIADIVPTFYSSFLLESVSRVVTIMFKLVPFAIGVDEASSQFIAENLGLGVTIGLTLAILRKGRILFWAIMGVFIILKRGITFAEILRHNELIGKETK